jgi:hypothetical protein
VRRAQKSKQGGYLKVGNKPMKLLSSILVLAIATTASSCSDDEVEVRSMC